MVAFAKPAGLHPFRLAFSQSAHYAPFPTCFRSSAPRFARRYLSSKRSPPGAPRPVSPSPPSPKLRLRSFERSPPPSPYAKNGPFAEFERLLANTKRRSVELFRAPSHRSYMIGTYVTAATFFAYAGYNGYAHCFNAPDTIAVWVRAFFGGIALIITWGGTILLLRGRNLISSIKAVRVNNETQLHFKVRRARPFAKPREIVAKPSELSISQQLVDPAVGTDSSWSKLRAQLDAHKQAQTASFWRAPIQKMSFTLWSIFTNQRRIFTREYFAYITVRGDEVLRLDLLGHISPEFEALGSDIEKK